MPTFGTATLSLQGPAGRIKTEITGERTSVGRTRDNEVVLNDPQLPFFISWDDPTMHPGRDPVAHRVPVGGIAWCELAGDREKVEHWMGSNDLPLCFVEGDEGLRRVALANENGEVVLDSLPM